MSVLEKIELNDPSLLRDELFIGGAWTPSGDNSRKAVVNPATGNDIAMVSMATIEDVKRAIAEANKAFKPWANMTAPARARILRAWYQLIVDNVEDLARILNCEQGKPLSESRAEIIYGAGFIEWYAEEGKRL